MTTIILLLISDVFMTAAWYGQLRYPQVSTVAAIFIGWAITLAVFAVFATLVFKEPIGWRYLGASGCLLGAAGFIFIGRA